MGLVTNLTHLAVDYLAGKDFVGRNQVVCVVKATYSWDGRGAVTPIEPAVSLRGADVYADDPATSGLIHAADLGPPKPALDVLLEGELVFPTPTVQVDVTLEIGRRLRKTIRVSGDRHWLPGAAADLVPSRPRPIARLPITWALSFGGTDPADPNCVERRNPVGRGLRRGPRDLAGQPLPNFEDPARPLRSWKDRPAPLGFGPVAPHWSPRRELAGTFDTRWEEERRPLLPEDFDAAFYNVAPADQQLDRFVPGEEVRLDLGSARERFRLPDLSVPVTFVGATLVHETAVEVDTVTISPAERRIALVARASFSPRPTVLSLRQIVVGLPTEAHRRAIRKGKRYVRWSSEPDGGS